MDKEDFHCLKVWCWIGGTVKESQAATCDSDSYPQRGGDFATGHNKLQFVIHGQHSRQGDYLLSRLLTINSTSVANENISLSVLSMEIKSVQPLSLGITSRQALRSIATSLYTLHNLSLLLYYIELVHCGNN